MPWRRVGLTLLAVPVLLLIALGVAVAPVGALVTLPVATALAAYGLVVMRAGDEGSGPAEPATADTSSPALKPDGAVHRHAGRVALVTAVATAGTVLLAAGLIALLGRATGPILLLAGFAALLWAWSRRGAGLSRYPRSGHAERPVVEPALALPGLESLSTRALCAAWQGSYFELAGANAAHRDEVTERRRRYLDELERRDPDGVARWLAVDDRAAGTDPHRHFCAGPGHRPPTRHSARHHPSRFRRRPLPPDPPPGRG